ncbi:hypothetical protein SAMN05444370_106168 [Rubrimonas cliftonensis]|uniref:Lipoprotein n=2 Tax=Rubrimonas cliftonensis TaxID=89524 RepID=A0A1H4C2I4_9RHOB|nr:hypothetical protein SAMN05444370_106168 [Rubrimonas cliftonensis]
MRPARMTKYAAALAVAATLAGCAGGEKTAEVDPYAHTRDSSCYTVDLFTDVEITPPAPSVPSDWKAFSGRWGGGKWAGEWCHDLYVLNIAPTGEVQVVETYAPYAPWGKRATAFTRRATIGKDGKLRLRYGDTSLVYWVKDGVLYGERDEAGGKTIIAMERRAA